MVQNACRYIIPYVKGVTLLHHISHKDEVFMSLEVYKDWKHEKPIMHITKTKHFQSLMIRIQDTTLHEQKYSVKGAYKYPLGECGRKKTEFIPF